ncbi:MAG TPA: hypothetical protein VK524_16915, partial [Polyangiaceae bacterium]|nr:hypothetical protein [Polyangiaceae bacterium]
EARAWPVAEPLPLLSLAEAARRALPALALTEAGELRARQGKRLGTEHFQGEVPAGASAVLAWFGAGTELVALGRREESGDFVVVRGFVPQTQ